jgi:hypothetical protein
MNNLFAFTLFYYLNHLPFEIDLIKKLVEMQLIS